MKRQTTIRLAGVTDRQLSDLAAWGHGGQAEVIMIAIDRMHREEKARRELAEFDRVQASEDEAPTN